MSQNKPDITHNQVPNSSVRKVWGSEVGLSREAQERIVGTSTKRKVEEMFTKERIGRMGTTVAEEPEVVIEARNLGMVYGRGENRVEALAGVSLNVEREEWISIVGPSGSGKSTLMNLLGLLDQPTSGRYVLEGREVSGLADGEVTKARRDLIGFVFQSYNLLPRETALGNVELPMVYAGVYGAERKRRAMEALERVGLSNRATHKPPELSGGQKQRVAIARALVNSPSIVLADEPTGNLDSKSGEGILELFGELKADGTTLIMVTHDTEVAERADRIVEVRDGRIVADESTHVDTTSGKPTRR